MLDLRKEKVIDLRDAKCLKDDTTYLYKEPVTGKNLIAKFFNLYDDPQDEFLLAEFKKIASLSAEPEIATVYFLATGDFGKGPRSCYVMDFIEGKSLGRIVKENECLSPAFVSETLRQIASGLEKAHHSEISHGDLHEENVMINQFGYVKLIDYMWWDYKLPFERNQPEDIIAFKKLVDLLMAKLKKEDVRQLEIQYNYLKGITSITGVAKNLSVLGEVSVELALMDEPSKLLLGQMVNSILPEANLMYVLQYKSVKIPENHMPELSERDKDYMERDKKNRFGFKFTDTRAESLRKGMDHLFSMKLHQLRQAGFIDWELWLENKGEKFIGPYTLGFQIFLTSKIFKWKRLDAEFKFLPKTEKMLSDLIFE